MKRGRGAVSHAGADLRRATGERWMGLIVITLLIAMTLVTAVAVVVSRHEARVLFHELEALKRIADDAAVEWDRLQIEESTFSTHSLIEHKARARLGMDMPGAAYAATSPAARGVETRPQLEYVRP